VAATFANHSRNHSAQVVDSLQVVPLGRWLIDAAQLPLQLGKEIFQFGRCSLVFVVSQHKYHLPFSFQISKNCLYFISVWFQIPQQLYVAIKPFKSR
jgi:hypothetical protein